MSVALDTKQCRTCGEIKEVSEFYSGRNQCKICYQADRTGSHLGREEERRWYFIERKYGVTRKQYFDLLVKQGGVCAICKTTEPGNGQSYFAVDHNHETNEVRGLLCFPCNLALGYLKDDTERARQLVRYLEED